MSQWWLMWNLPCAPSPDKLHRSCIVVLSQADRLPSVQPLDRLCAEKKFSKLSFSRVSWPQYYRTHSVLLNSMWSTFNTRLQPVFTCSMATSFLSWLSCLVGKRSLSMTLTATSLPDFLCFPGGETNDKIKDVVVNWKSHTCLVH